MVWFNYFRMGPNWKYLLLRLHHIYFLQFRILWKFKSLEYISWNLRDIRMPRIRIQKFDMKKTLASLWNPKLKLSSHMQRDKKWDWLQSFFPLLLRNLYRYSKLSNFLRKCNAAKRILFGGFESFLLKNFDIT